MNLKQLEYFVAIAEERQITAAARRLDARGRWLQGAHAGRPLDRPRARAEQSASLNE